MNVCNRDEELCAGAAKIGRLGRGIAGVYRRTECRRLQYSSAIWVVAAEGVSAADDLSRPKRWSMWDAHPPQFCVQQLAYF